MTSYLENFRILILVAFILTNSDLIAQNKNETVAKIGNRFISVDEFKFRYELTPQLFREQKRVTNELKLEFLYTLIAEKLLAAYGETISLDTSEIVKLTLKNFEEMFVRDALYDLMIVEKAKYKADSLLGFYLANATMAKCRFIKSNTYEEAERIFNLLEKGVPFDFLLTDSTKYDSIAVTFGQFNEEIENEILTLPEDMFTRPIQLGDEWYILNVEVKYYPIIDKTAGWESEYRRLQNLAKERAEYAFYKEYMKKTFENLSVKANGKLLKVFAEEVFNLLERKKQLYGTQNKYYLNSADLALVSVKLTSDVLNQNYFIVNDESVTLKDFLFFLRFENISFDSVYFQNVLDVFNSKTKKFIEHKILAHEGYKYGLEKNKSVLDKYNMWKENYYYQLVQSEFIDSAEVTDEELMIYYNQLNKGKFKSKEVKVVEVLITNLEDAEKVLNELETGSDIIDLAEKYSVKNQSSEIKFKPISAFGEATSIIDKMKIDEVYGPVKVKDGYIILKLLEVKEDSSSDKASFEEIKKQFSQELRYLKKKDMINKFIGKLAAENKININEELLKNIRTTTHNAVVFEMLGFGGKLTAVPLISPNSEWVEHWLNSLKVIP